MKTTRKFLQLTFIALLCMAMVAGVMSFSVAAESIVTSVTVDGNKVLNDSTPYLVDTGAGYVADDGTLLATYTWVAQFDPVNGILILRDYDGGAVSTSATGDLTIKLIGNNTVSHTSKGIEIYGGNLVITSEVGGSLSIVNTDGEALRICGIVNNYDDGYADTERSGDGVTVNGNANVSISSVKEGASMGASAIGIGTYGNIWVLDKASLSVAAINQDFSISTGLRSLTGSILINTNGDVAISVQSDEYYFDGEDLFVADSTEQVILGAVGEMRLNWSYHNCLGTSVIEYSSGLTNDSYVIGTLPDDTTSATYAYKFPISVVNGVAKIGDQAVESASKGTTVTLVADTPEAGRGFYQWSCPTENAVFANHEEATTTFTMPAASVEIEANYASAHNVIANSATVSVESAVSGKTVTVTAAEPEKGYAFEGWTVVSGGVTLADPTSSTTTFTMGDADVEITALYTPISYPVTVTGGEASIDGTPTSTATIADTVTLTANTPPAGKVFKEWIIESGEGSLTDATAATTTLTAMFGDLTVKATYEDAIYTVTVENGTADPATAKMGDTVTVTAASVVGKTFKEWQVVSSSVSLADKTAATTTFTVGTENVELVATYDYTDYTVSIKDGKGYVNSTDNQITNANIGDDIQITADDPESGYAFIRWNVLSGEIELEDPTNQYTSFTMIAGNVELEAVYAEIVVLDELRFTMTSPTVGEHPSFVLTSQEPEKYGYSNLEIALNQSPYSDLTPEDVYELGKAYSIKFRHTLANGYEIDGETKVYLNGIEMNRNLPWWQYDFDFPVPITVICGKGYADGSRTEEISKGLNQYVYLKADETPEGKHFMGWVVRSGDITISYANSKEAAFLLKNEPVTVEAVFATVLDQVVLTVTKPKVGDTATIEITSADPEKYTAVLDAFSLGKSPYTVLLPTDTFEHGNPYDMRFEIIVADGYTVTWDTVITLNGEETSSYGGAEQREWSFKLPVLVTVTGGTAYTSNTYETEIGEVYSGSYVYLKAGDAPEGKKFWAWKITDGTGTYYYSYDISWYVGNTVTTLTCEVIWAIPIDNVEGTMPPIVVGQTPITTVTDNSDLYDIVIDGWYYYDEEHTAHEMLPTDTYQPNVEYKCEFSIIPIAGYLIDYYGDVDVKINGKEISTSGCESDTGIVYARAYYFDTVYVSFDITGGKLYVDGVETNETKFLPGTVLTLKPDESLYPEGQVFKKWNTPYVYGTIIGVTDYRLPILTFTVGVPFQFDSTIVIEALYQTLTSTYDLDTYVAHPIIGGTPSYDVGLNQWNNYHGEVLGWYEGETLLEPDHVFEADKTYTVKIRLTPAAGYYFPELDFYYLSADNYFSGNFVEGNILERGEEGEYIIFEASIKAKHHQPSVSVDVVAPVAGKAPETTVTKGENVFCTVQFVYWKVYDEETEKFIDITAGQLFEVGKTYRAYVKFFSNDIYFIGDELETLINGIEGTNYSNGTTDGGYRLSGYYVEFTVAAGESFDIAVENGSATVDETPVSEVGGGITVTITANAPAEGKAFKEWIVVSGDGVILADATAATTTFVMPAGDISIKAVYRNTPHDITVEGGTADLTFAGSGETITITANEAPDGKYFAGWECVSGGVTFADATAKTTTFVMTGEAVTVKATYADKILLETMEFTIVAPANGEHPTYVITSAEPEKYTATVDYWYSNSTYEDLTPESVFVYGEGYTVRFRITASEKYTFNYDTNVTLNDLLCGSYGLDGRQCSSLNVLVPITVEGGYAVDGNKNVITGQRYNYYVELVGDDAPEGKCFSHWEVVAGGVTVSYPTYQKGAYFTIGKEPVTVRAIYHTHTYGDDYQSNATHHWKECNDPDCTDKTGSKTAETEHTPGPAATFDSAQTCTACGYELAPKLTGRTVNVTNGKIYVDDVEVPSGTKIASGTVVKLVADVPEGKHLYYWSGNTYYVSDIYAVETTLTIGTGTGTVTLEAVLHDNPTVTVEGGKIYVGGEEIASGSKIAPNTEVKIVADAPDEGRYFGGWSGSTSLLADKNATETTFTMGTSNVSFTAKYNAYSAVPYDYFYFDFLVPYTGGKPVDGDQEDTYNKSVSTVIGYYDGETKLTSANTFVQGKSYTVELRIVPQTGYYFDTAKTYRIYQADDETRAEIVSLTENEIICRFTYVALTPITEVTVSFTLPVSGQQASFVATLPEDAPYTVSAVEWCVGDRWYTYADTLIFENGETYAVWMELLPKEGYTFSPYVEIDMILPAGFVADSDWLEAYGFTGYVRADYVCAPNPSKATVSVTDGGAYVYEADDPSSEESIGTRLYLFANEPVDGKVFLKWEIVSGNAVIDDPYAAETSFLLAENVVIKATYADNVERTITVTGGTADKATAKAGETVTLTANAAPEGKYFYKWDVKSGGATLANSYETTTTFTMTGEAVEIEAVFLDPITEIVLKTDANKPTVGGGAAPFTVYSVNGSTELAYLIDIWAGWYIMPTAAVDWDNEKSVGYYPTFGEAYYVVYFEIWNDEEAELFDENCKLILQFNDGDIEAVFEDIGTKFTWIDFIATFNLTHTHSYGEKIAEVPATHTATELKAGKKAHYYCEGCDTYFDENKNPVEEEDLIIPAPTHSFGEWITSDATNHWKVCDCGKKDAEDAHDYTDASDMICNVCGHDRTAPHTHGNGQKVSGQAAGCTVDGWKDYYQCSCGQYYTDAACTVEITDLVAWKAGDGKLAASHTYGTPIAKKDANCTETGMQAHYECSVCHTLFDENKNVKTEAELTITTNDSHNFGAWTSNGNGTHTRTCSRNAAHKETEACAGGTATCTQKATCSTCNTAYGDLGAHDYGTLIPTTPEKHTQTELAASVATHYRCSVCNKYFTEGKEETTLDALTGETPTHSYGDWITSDDTNHWKVCECGKKDAEGAHEYTDASDMTCNICGHDRTAPHSHGNGTKISGQAAGCTADGWKDYYQCSCGQYYTDAACTVEITDLVAWKAGDGKIAALTHAWGAWTSNGDGTHTRVCGNNAEHKENGDCAGGTATCTQKATCSTCNAAYGNLAAHAHGSEWKSDGTNHWNECICGDKANEAPHTPNADDGDCTTAITCSVCGAVTTEAKAAHTDADTNGKCDACGKDVSVTPPAHEHTFVEGKCECGETDPNYVPPHEHTFVEGKCECGERDPNYTLGIDDSEEPKKGLSGGAIAGIVIGSVAVAGVGGFAVWWFAVSKHTFAQLGAACKSIAGTVADFFKGLFEKIKNLFSKK